MHSISDYLAACQERREFLAQQIEWIDAERKNYRRDVGELESSLHRIRQETVGYLLPEVSHEYLSQLEQRLQYPGLLDIKAKYDQLFQDAEARRATLEAMDEIKYYDLHHHRAEEALADITPSYQRVVEQQEVWENNPRFAGLKRRNFFGLEKSRSWWHSFLNWRDVSLLMSHLRRHGHKYSTPTEVRDHYRLFREQANDTIAAYQSRLGERDRIVNLRQELKDLEQAPQRLLAELYQELGEAILAHLRACPDEVKVRLAEQDSLLDTFFRKDIGTKKQIDYLKELSVARLDSQQNQLDQELQKLDSKIQKLNMQRRRGKRKYYSDEQLTQMRDYKPEKWTKRRVQATEVRERISSFDHYDRGSYLEQYLWWDLMTRGMPGHDIVEVRHFHETHPDWDYRQHSHGLTDDTNDNTLDGAASSLAASMLTPQDDSLRDAS